MHMVSTLPHHWNMIPKPARNLCGPCTSSQNNIIFAKQGSSPFVRKTMSNLGGDNFINKWSVPLIQFSHLVSVKRDDYEDLLSALDKAPLEDDVEADSCQVTSDELVLGNERVVPFPHEYDMALGAEKEAKSAKAPPSRTKLVVFDCLAGIQKIVANPEQHANEEEYGQLKLDLAQYREMAAFAQFGSDLDAATQRLLNRGARLTELLKQPQFSPMPFEEQTVSIFAGTNGYIDSVPVDRVTEYEEQMLSYMRTEHAGVLEEIRTTGKFEDDTKNKVVDALKTFAKQFA